MGALCKRADCESALGGRAEGVVIAIVTAMTATESTTISIETGASATVAMPMVTTVGTLAAAGMTMPSGPAVQGTILTLESRPTI